MAREVDVVVIGSGHNGLVAAAYLARAGAQVEVLERNPVPGGAVATEELTLPGFRHDTFSSWHPLFHLSAAFAELGDELRARGLEYANTDLPAATAYGDGAAVCAYRDPERTASGFAGRDDRVYAGELERFGAHAETIAELLGTELWSRRAARLALRLTRRLGRRGALELARDVTASARSWLESRFEGDAPARLYGPWVLHTGLSPDAAGGAFQLLALAGGLHQVGMPVVRGGSLRLVEALVRLIEDHGGAVRTGTTVERILVERGRAVGVIAAGEEARARRAVIANVTPTQLYGQLLPAGTAPPRAVEQAQRFRYCARGDMQIHLALDEPPRWRDERLAGAAVVHVTEGLDAIAVACAEASAGLLPARPTIVCGQPTALDPSRAPGGKGDSLDPAPGDPLPAAGRRRRGDRRRGRGVDQLARGGVLGAHRGTARPARRKPPGGDHRPSDRVADRARAPQPQPATRGSVRRGDRPRPKLPLAPPPRLRLAPHAGAAPLPVRREHLSGAGPQCGLGADRRPGAVGEGGSGERAGSEGSPGARHDHGRVRAGRDPASAPARGTVAGPCGLPLEPQVLIKYFRGRRSL